MLHRVMRDGTINMYQLYRISCFARDARCSSLANRNKATHGSAVGQVNHIVYERIPTVTQKSIAQFVRF